MIMEAHDLLEPTCLEECAGLMDEHPDASLVGCWIAELEEDTGRTVQIFTPRFNRIQEGSKLAEYLVSRPDAPIGLTALIRRSALGGLEPWFDPKYWWYPDIHLSIR